MKYHFHTPELLEQIPEVCGIYQITCLVNNKIYDGKAVNIRIRTRYHIYDSKNKNSKSHYNMPIHAAFRAHGIENFVIEILEECKKEDLNRLEKYYIALHKSKDRSIGYNIADGGDGGRLCTKITETQAYLIKELIPFGYTLPEIYALFKEAYPENNLAKSGIDMIYRGYNYSEINKKAFNVSDEIRLINRINRTTGINITKIIDLISEGASSIDIYNRYVNHIPENLLIYLIKHKEIPNNIRTGFTLCVQERTKKIKGINLITGEAVIFNSLKSASVIMSIDIGSMSMCCTGYRSRSSAGGYKWEYID
jgi:group I intron endonuclease